MHHARSRRPLSLVVAAAVVTVAGVGLLAPAASAAPRALTRPLERVHASHPRRVHRSAHRPPPRAFFGLGPASATAVDRRPFFSWGVTPGGELSDHVAIVNYGAEPVTVLIFATNAVNLANGGTGFQSVGQARGGPASWITLTFPHHSATLHLRPHSTVIVPITVHVPRNAPPGDHVGAIIASLTSSIVSRHHARLHLVQQVATRALIRVSGPLRPRLSITGLTARYHARNASLTTGTTTLSFTVSNTGNVLLGGQEAVSVHGLFGSTETVHPATIPVMLPGGSVHQTVTVSGVYPEVYMDATVSVTPLVVTGQADPGLRVYSAHVHFWAVPWPLLALLIVLILIGAWLERRRRNRRRSAAVSGGSAGQVAPTVDA